MSLVLIFLIFFSLMFFVLMKVQQSKAEDIIDRRRYKERSSIAIGIFFISFAFNSYSSLQSTPAAFVLVLFTVFGGINIFFGFKNLQSLNNQSVKNQSENR